MKRFLFFWVAILTMRVALFPFAIGFILGTLLFR